MVPDSRARVKKKTVFRLASPYPRCQPPDLDTPAWLALSRRLDLFRRHRHWQDQFRAATLRTGAGTCVSYVRWILCPTLARQHRPASFCGAAGQTVDQTPLPVFRLETLT
jgi:hypothetical protein